MLLVVLLLQVSVHAAEPGVGPAAPCVDDEALHEELDVRRLSEAFEVRVGERSEEDGLEITYEVRCSGAWPACRRRFPVPEGDPVLTAVLPLRGPQECEAAAVSIADAVERWVAQESITLPTPGSGMATGGARQLRLTASAAPHTTRAPRAELALQRWTREEGAGLGWAARGLLGAPVVVPRVSYCVPADACDAEPAGMYLAPQAGLGGRLTGGAVGVGAQAWLGPLLGWGTGYERAVVDVGALVDLTGFVSVRFPGGVELVAALEAEPLTVVMRGDTEEEAVRLPPVRGAAGISIPLAPPSRR